jgi:hypothetical protein
MRSAISLGLVLWLCLWWATPASAQLVSGGEGYALLVGSNVGGPGQANLRYAESDTERVSDVLTSLGGYAPERVERLVQPTAQQLLAALDRVREHVSPLSRQGVQSRFFFYYSGHARSDALNLADSQLPLSELRARIEALPATLSIVVLDACQSGAFSRPKGANRATDFSFNSVERLNTAGIAVIASSNEKELSQESDNLRSSHFTHHWLVALRGGGDHNHDGRVTLSEAYQYAYNHTLATTAETAVGEQHVTLETNLRGQDEVPLTQPAAARARLRIPAEVDGRLLVQALPSWSVMAELDKPRGESVLLALPAGDYAVTLRQGRVASRCSVRLQDGHEFQLEAKHCPVLEQFDTQVKGELELTREDRRAQRRAERVAQRLAEDAADVGKDEHVVFELGMGPGLTRDSAYRETLRDFSFVGANGTQVRAAASAGYRLLPHLVLGLGYYNLEARTYSRDQQVDQRFDWTGHAFNAFAQADVSVGRRRLFNLFVKVGVGLSVAWTNFEALRIGTAFPEQSASLETTSAGKRDVMQHFVRPCGFLGGGFSIMPGRYLGFFAEVRYVLAPAIRNELDQWHDLGGTDFIFGVRARSWE